MRPDRFAAHGPHICGPYTPSGKAHLVAVMQALQGFVNNPFKEGANPWRITAVW